MGRLQEVMSWWRGESVEGVTRRRWWASMAAPVCSWAVNWASRAADHIVALSSPANRHSEKDKKKKKGRMTEKEGKNERNKEKSKRWMKSKMLNEIEQEKRDKICGDKLKNGWCIISLLPCCGLQHGCPSSLEQTTESDKSNICITNLNMNMREMATVVCCVHSQ